MIPLETQNRMLGRALVDSAGGRRQMRCVEAADPSLTVGAPNLAPQLSAGPGKNFTMAALTVAARGLALAAFRATLLGFLLPLAAASSLGDEITEILTAKAAERSFWGIKVVDLAAGDTVYEKNSAKLFLPASNAKLFSTALGLFRLGPEYFYTTMIVSELDLASGTSHRQIDWHDSRGGRSDEGGQDDQAGRRLQWVAALQKAADIGGSYRPAR